MKSLIKVSAAVLAVAFLSNGTVVQAAPSKSSTPQASTQAQSKVNINKANSSQLATALKGVGLKKADAIVEYRSKFGDFKSVDELTSVKGIGAKTVAKNRHLISL